MVKTYIYVLIIICSFFLIGCSGSNDVTKPAENEYIIDNTARFFDLLERKDSDFTVILETGIYNLKNVDLNYRKNIKIKGALAEDTIIYGNFELKSCYNISFQSLNIRYRGIGNDRFIFHIKKSQGISIENVMMENSKSNTIEVVDSNLTVKDVVLKDSNRNGIVGLRDSLIVLENSTISRCETYGVAMVESVIAIKSSIIEENIDGNLVGEKSSEVFLNDSTVRKSINGFGIRIRQSKLNMDNSNSLNNHGEGILLLKGASGIVTNSYVSFNGKNGLYSEGAVLQVENTVFENNNRNGVRILDTEALFRDILSIGSESGNGLYAYNSNVNIVKSIFHINNKNGVALENSVGNVIAVLCSYSDETSGLYVKNSSIEIKKSAFKNNETDGIKILDDSDVSIHMSSMLENYSDGIDIANSSLTLIQSISKSNIGFGINTSHSKIRLSDSDIEDNGRGGVNNDNSELIYE